jgi:hypothetical protein
MLFELMQQKSNKGVLNNYLTNPKNKNKMKDKKLMARN